MPELNPCPRLGASVNVTSLSHSSPERPSFPICQGRVTRARLLLSKAQVRPCEGRPRAGYHTEGCLVSELTPPPPGMTSHSGTQATASTAPALTSSRCHLLSGEQPRKPGGGGGQKMEPPGQQGGGREEKGRPQERCGRNPRSQQLEGRSRQVGPTLGKQCRAGRRPGHLAGPFSSLETPGCPSGLRAKHCP